MATASELIRQLDLHPHPEGGWYRETYRSQTLIAHPNGQARASLTQIFFLLEGGQHSAWHEVASDEAWHHYAGGPLTLRLISPQGQLTTHALGPALALGQRPQAVVPAGWLQAAEVSPEAGYALCGCTVAPGFEYADFSLPSRAELTLRHPELADEFSRLSS